MFLFRVSCLVHRLVLEEPYKKNQTQISYPQQKAYNHHISNQGQLGSSAPNNATHSSGEVHPICGNHTQLKAIQIVGRPTVVCPSSGELKLACSN